MQIPLSLIVNSQSKVKRLDLSKNPLSNENAEEFCQLMADFLHHDSFKKHEISAYPCRATTLNFSWMNLRGHALIIAQAVAINKSVASFQLHDNNMGEDNIAELFSLMDINKDFEL